MDGKGFQVWLSAARGLSARSGARRSRCCRAGARARHRRPRSSLVWTRPGAVRGASEGAVSRGMARGLRRTSASGRTFERYAAVTLAVVRGVAGEGGDGEGLGGALRRGGEHGVPLASPVSGGGAERRRCSRGSGSGRDLWRAGRARAGWRKAGGGAARRRSAASRASRTGSHGGGPERNDGQRGAPGSMRRRSRLPSTRWSRRTPCWSPTAARATHRAPPRSG